MAKKRLAAQRSTQQLDELQQLRDALTKGMSAEPTKNVKMKVNTHKATQIDSIEIDRFALDVLESTMPEWVSEKLQEEMKESLRGYSERAALWIAESLSDCCYGVALATTGIKHIDDMLWPLYSEILNYAREKGVRIANHD